jgi:hypothetical protein
VKASSAATSSCEASDVFVKRFVNRLVTRLGWLHQLPEEDAHLHLELSLSAHQIRKQKKEFKLSNPVLWIRNFSLRIRIRLFNEFRIRIRILLSKSSGVGSDLFPDEI